MPIKFRLDTLEGLDTTIAALYSKADDGKYYAQVEGAVAKERLDEFRTNNINLTRDLETARAESGSWKTKYDDLKANAPKKDDYVLKTDVDDMVNTRVATMKEEHDAALKERDDKLANQDTQLSSLLIDSAVRRAATEHKVLDTAVDDVILRAKMSFKVEDGKAVAYDDKGNVVYGKDGSTPQSIGEWVESLKGSAGHLFEGSQGSGAYHHHQSSADMSKMSPLQKITGGLAARST